MGRPENSKGGSDLAMSDYSRYLTWDRRCRDRGAFGMTAGDSLYLGLRDFNEPYPCPNGMPLDTRKPGDCEHWRRRVAKAKRDIEDWNRDIAITRAAEAITDEDLELFISEIRKFQNVRNSEI